MPVGTSHRGRAGYRIAAREVPTTWLAAGAVVALGLLLIAGGGPLRPALATFGIGLVVALTLAWLHGAVARHRARRRAESAHAAVMREGMARLRTAGAEAPDLEASDLLAALAALAGADTPGPPRSLAALARAAAAEARSHADARGVRLIVAVGEDTTVRGAGLEPALRGLLMRAATTAPAGSTVTAAIRSGRVEIRDEAAPGGGDAFPADLARAVAHRAGGELHVFARADVPGTLAVLELPDRS
jgi:hypothetical protein